jgi:MmyB-like transcription regulator ligand binding domain
MRPAANTPSSRGTRTSAVPASTRTSANWAPNEYLAWSGSASMSAAVAACAERPPAGTCPSLALTCSRSARQALTTAQLHDAVPIEPPAIIAGGSALSPMRRSMASSPMPSASAATVSNAAYLKGRRWDVLAANRAARALFTDWSARAPGDRNKIWWMFTDPAARKVYVDWEQEAADMLGRFRAAAARRLDDPDFTGLIERLHQASPEVRDWWPRYDVRSVGGGTKHLHHPALGDVVFRHAVLQVADRPEQTLVYFTTTEVPESKLADLAAGMP